MFIKRFVFFFKEVRRVGLIDDQSHFVFSSI